MTTAPPDRNLPHGLRELADHFELFPDTPEPYVAASYTAYGPTTLERVMGIMDAYPQEADWTITPGDGGFWVNITTDLAGIPIRITADGGRLSTVAPEYKLQDLNPRLAARVTVVPS